MRRRDRSPSLLENTLAGRNAFDRFMKSVIAAIIPQLGAKRVEDFGNAA
jgi:hypothetical protein